MLKYFHLYRKRLSLFFALVALAPCLSACGFKWPEWATRDEDPLAFLGNNERDPQTPPPPDLLPKDAPDQDDPASKLVPSSVMGVNLETYFLQDIKDPITRIQRLENVIMAMQRDMQGTLNVTPMRENYGMPVEGAFQEGAPPVTGAVDRTPLGAPSPGAPQPLLGPAANAEPAAPLSRPPEFAPPGNSPPAVPPLAPELEIPAAASSERAIALPPPSAAAGAVFPPSAPSAGSLLPPPQAAAEGAAVTGIRAGKHPDKIRIVFDVSGQTSYRADLDNAEHLLVVEIADASWLAPFATKSFENMEPLKSYSAESLNGHGSRVIFELTANASIVYERALPALYGGGGRIIIDLAQ